MLALYSFCEPHKYLLGRLPGGVGCGLGELLGEYDFEKTDFVYEAGQYAVRGGIVDVFSYANELPFRLELFGDEIESIRTFNPETQLSVEPRPSISIIPNVQTKMLHETREAFFDFLPRTTCIWVKDVRQTLDVVSELFEKAEANFQQMLAEAHGVPLEVVSVGADDETARYRDAEGAWSAVRGVGDDGAVLVRPDQHVAWRGASASPHAEQELDEALARALGRPAGVTTGRP